jgi:hypothetical protein
MAGAARYGSDRPVIVLRGKRVNTTRGLTGETGFPPCLWRRRESNPRRRSASDQSQEDPDLAPADTGESASNEGHKQKAASADDELPFIHPEQLSVFDSLSDG